VINIKLQISLQNFVKNFEFDLNFVKNFEFEFNFVKILNGHFKGTGNLYENNFWSTTYCLFLWQHGKYDFIAKKFILLQRNPNCLRHPHIKQGSAIPYNSKLGGALSTPPPPPAASAAVFSSAILYNIWTSFLLLRLLL
jgi:hypothetical protein